MTEGHPLSSLCQLGHYGVLFAHHRRTTRGPVHTSCPAHRDHSRFDRTNSQKTTIVNQVRTTSHAIDSQSFFLTVSSCQRTLEASFDMSHLATDRNQVCRMMVHCYLPRLHRYQTRKLGRKYRNHTHLIQMRGRTTANVVSALFIVLNRNLALYLKATARLQLAKFWVCVST
jgi:hypothetical protein